MTTLGVGKPQPPTIELLAQYAILLDQVLHRGHLVATQPAGDSENQELKRRRTHTEPTPTRGAETSEVPTPLKRSLTFVSF